MKKCLFLPFFIVALLCISCQRNKPLTEQQRVDDFLYLYNSLESSYPHFEVSKRKTGTDWLAKKEEFLERVRAADNDTAYINTLTDILNELKDGHTDISPTLYWQMMLNIYKKVAVERTEYAAWVDAVESATPRVNYWASILKSDITDESQEQAESQTVTSHYRDSIIEDRGIAIMRIPSIADELIKVDSIPVTDFINKLDNRMKYLIIDIQGNGGGSTSYWSELIVPRLTKDTIFFSQYYAIKDSKLNRTFYQESFTPEKTLDRENPFYSIIRPEFHENGYHLAEEKDLIAPNQPVNFDGKIMLLVDRSVFSSAEGFAYFSGITGWAEVVGQNTAGDGVGSDPILVVLPESKIIARFPVTAGFNADGSVNAETGTTPNTIIEGNTRAERLQNLINMLD